MSTETVDVGVDNKPISIELGDGESTTVPSGETWDVTISGSSNSTCAINGVEVSGNGQSFDTVLTGGDTIAETTSNGTGLMIGGYEVSP